jgi:DNA-binding NarL/FixJ family response regulator
LTEKIRILLAEDEGLLRGTLAELLGREPDLTVVAAAANGRDALIEALHHRPDVVLTDLRMPRMEGIELTRELKEKLPESAVVVLTAFDDDEHLFAAIKAGATAMCSRMPPCPRSSRRCTPRAEVKAFSPPAW